MNRASSGGFQSEINVTPLIDVVLVLLIIFMVIVPLTMRGYDVDIPGEAVVAPASASRIEQVVLEIDLQECPVLEPPAQPGLPLDCTVRIDDEKLPVDQLASRVTEIFTPREQSDRVLFLAAHERLNYEGVMRILDFAKSGIDGLRIGMVTGG